MMKKRLSKTLWYGSDVDSEGNPIIPSSAKSANDLEGLHYGELYIHLSDQITLWSVAKNGEVQQIAGGDKVDLSGYLLKSIWDKVWEIRTDPTGKEYIFGKLPVVTQYGITMYADGGNIDLPSLYAGLPIDGKTIYWDNGILKAVGSSGGGGVTDSVAWANVTGKPLWITDAKPTYTYSDIQETPDLTKYALKTDLPSLSGYATEQWVIGQNYVNSTSLANELKKYVSIDNDETINGLKNFKKGLQIDGLGISKPQDDVIYLDANLVVRGGITMYADNTVDIPSIIDSLPIASTTNKGIASFDGEYFSVSNGKVTLLEGNIGLNEAELAAYLSNNKYATQSWVQSLGYATTSDLDSRINALVNGAPAAYDTLKEIADILAGNVDSIGDIITTLGTKWTQDNAKIANWDAAYSWGNHGSVGYALKSYVDTEFAKYVTLATAQSISGEKNFTGGLKVNGSPIIYDATNKYWKLEGDLLVTGGVTMYGSDSSFTPSTIMDAIAVDGTTISKSGGVLKVIGGTGGGVADSVAWANITGKPTWIGSSKPSYSYSEITGAISTTELQNYLTSNSYLNVTSGDNRYLQLSGGTLRGGASISWGNANNGLTDTPDWNIKTDGLRILSSITSGSNAPSQYAAGLHVVGRYGFQIACEATSSNFYMRNIRDGVNNWCKLWHTGNDGSGSGLDADLLDNHHEEDFVRGFVNNVANLNTPFTTNRPYIWRYGSENSNVPSGASYYSNILHVGVNGNDTAFDLLGSYYNNRLFFRTGTWSADGSGTIFTNAWKEIAFTDSNVASATKLQTARTIWGQSFDGTGNVSGQLTNVSIVRFGQEQGIFQGDYYSTSLTSYDIAINGQKLILNPSGNVGIGTANPTHKLSVYGGVSSVPALGNLVGAGLSVGYTGSYGLHLYTISNGNGAIQCGREDGSPTAYALLLNPIGGNVGIGTTSPNQKLHVEGGVRVNGQIIGANSIVSNTTNGFFVGNRNDGLGVTDGGLLLYTYGKTPISFYANGERMRIDASTGNVGIGTSIPYYKLDVNGVAKATSLYADSYVWLAPNSDAIYINNTAIAWHNSSNAWTDTLILFARNSITLNKNTTVQGNILATGGITMYSMRKLKNVVNERGLSLSELSAIKPTRYTWKDGRDNRLHFGGIADDIKQVLPEVVYTTSDGILTMDYGNAAFAVASSLIKPVVDHEKRIAILQKRIVELEEEVERLKSA